MNTLHDGPTSTIDSTTSTNIVLSNFYPSISRILDNPAPHILTTIRTDNPYVINHNHFPYMHLNNSRRYNNNSNNNNSNNNNSNNTNSNNNNSNSILHDNYYIQANDTEEEDPRNDEWNGKNETEKENFYIFMRILQSMNCPICREMCMDRRIVCTNGHVLCNDCIHKHAGNNCCLCREPMLHQAIPLREMAGVKVDVLAAVHKMIKYKVGDPVDVRISQSILNVNRLHHEMSIDDEDMKQEEDEYNNYEDDEDEDDDTVEELLCDHTTEWMEGRIIIVDYDSMTFLVRTRGAMMHFPFFSARLADIHTYTIPWRNMNTLKIGRKMEVLLDTLDWIPGIIVMRDLLHSTVHIATCQDGRIVVEPFHIESSLRITLFPTYLSDSTNWIKIE